MNSGDVNSPPESSKAKTVRQDLSRCKSCLFRLVAAGIPATAGLIVVIAVLVHKERLVIDPETGWIKLQSPPIYLEEPGHERTGHRYLYDERLGWRNIPRWNATTNSRRLTINSQGLRDREYTYDKPAGVQRILVLGDSFAWGYGVSDEQIFTEVLERQLEQSRRDWEVINAGVSGWGTDQEYLFLIDEGLRYAPDVVVLAFFIVNDPENNVHANQYGLHKPVFANTRLELANVPVPKPNERSSTSKSAAHPIDMSIAIVAKMSEVCAKHDCRLVVMKFGTFLRPDDPILRRWDEQFRQTVESLESILFLDLDQEFAACKIPTPKLLDGNDDGHWNSYGHAVTADILLRFLNERDLLDPAR